MFSLSDYKRKTYPGKFNDLGTLYLLLSARLHIIHETVNATTWHNKSIISLKDQTNILLLGSNQHSLIEIQGVKLSNFVLKGLNFKFGIRNAQDSGYIGEFYMKYIENCIQTKPFVQIKANFGIHKIRNRQIILF